MSFQNKKIALLLIDIQKGFNSPRWGKRDTPQAEENIAKLLKGFRKSGRPIYHVQHLSKNPKSPLAPGQPGVDFMDVAKPEFGERLFQKHVNSAFIGTNLQEILLKDQIQSLVIIGIAVDHCVSTTTRMAANLGFEVLIPADATVAFDRQSFEGAIYPAEDVHAITLASLHGEFATVLSTGAVLDMLEIS